MAKFLTELCASLKDDDRIWILHEPLIYISDIVGRIEVPISFQTDFASVPRVPIIYELYGDKAHRESVLHDYLYCIDSIPQATFDQANQVFLEAMIVRGKPEDIRNGMYQGVCLFGHSHYHKRYVGDQL
jgi:hypothetical protein